MSDEAVDQPVTAGADPVLDVGRIAALRVVQYSTDRPPAQVELRSAVIDRLIGAQNLLPREFRLLVVAGFACPYVADHRIGGAVIWEFRSRVGPSLRVGPPRRHPVGTPSRSH